MTLDKKKEQEMSRVLDRQVLAKDERIDVLEALELVLLYASERLRRVGRQYDRLLGEQLIDIAQVSLVLDLRFVGWRNEFRLQGLPVNLFEKLMLLDLAQAVIWSEAIHGWLLQKAYKIREIKFKKKNSIE